MNGAQRYISPPLWRWLEFHISKSRYGHPKKKQIPFGNDKQYRKKQYRERAVPGRKVRVAQIGSQ